MMKMYPGGGDLTEDQFNEMVELSVKSMANVRSMSMMLGVGEGQQPLYGSMMLAFQVENAEQYIKDYLEFAGQIGELMSETGFPFSYEVEAMQIEGRSGVKLAMDMEGFMGEQEIPQAEQVMQMMFGQQGTMDVYMAAVDEHTVLGSYVTKDLLISGMNALKEGKEQLADEAGVAKTVAMLDDDAQFVGLWSPQGTLAFAARVAGAIDPNAAAAIPQLEASSPIGFSATLTPEALETDTAVPTDVMTSIAALVRQIIAARMQQAQPNAF
jgi:hypothetical protein